MEKIIQNVIATGSREKKAFYIAIIALLTMSFFYAYFVNQTVVNIVERQSVQTKITDLSSYLSELEFEYMKHKSTLTLEHTKSIGFVDADETIFISRRPTDTRLTLVE